MPSDDPRPTPHRPDPTSARRFAVRQLPLVRIGAALAACAVAASVFGAVQTTAVARTDAAGWAVVSAVSAVIMLVACAIQAVGWQLLADGRVGAAPGSGVRQVSIAAHLVSYPVVVVGLFATASLAVAEGAEPAALLLTVVAAVALVAAQAMAAANYVRDSGDGGTVPAHLRRLRAFDRSRREAPDPYQPDEAPDAGPGPSGRV